MEVLPGELTQLGDACLLHSPLLPAWKADTKARALAAILEHEATLRTEAMHH